MVSLAALLAALTPGPTEARPGDLYVGDSGAHAVIKINHRTGGQRIVASGGDLDSPDSGAFSSSGALIIAD